MVIVKNGKNSFVECLISNNICKDYSCVLIYCCRYPQTWKLGSLNMLLNDYTSKERYFDPYVGDSRLTQDINRLSHHLPMAGSHPVENDSNCLHSCVNIGMNPLWLTMYIDENENENNTDTYTRYHYRMNYNRDSIIAAFECFRLIIECKNISSYIINRLLNSRMKDDISIVETCMANSIVNNKFIEYLMKNNDKHGWKIDYYQSNVLQLACLVGNYKILKYMTSTSDKTMADKNLQHVISQFGFEPSGGKFLFQFFGQPMNDFNSIIFYKNACNSNQ